MRDQRITAIILAATEMGGMGNDYFECKTRHLLPIADKTLIQHLIETVDKLEDVRTNYTIIIEEKVDKNEKKKPCEDVYKSLFINRIDDDIKLVGQKPLTQGTFEAVRGCIEGKDKKEEVFPILVLYGDTLVEEKFLKRIVNEVARNKGESRVVWGLIKSKKEKSDVYCVKRKYPEDEDGFSTIFEEDIFDIFEYPLEEDNYFYLHDTGIMVISESAWNDVNKLIDRIHRPSSVGLFSFTNLIKQALVFKNVSVDGIRDVHIKIAGIVAPEGYWNEANYPWEMLELNKTKISDVVKDVTGTGKKEKNILIREGAEWTKEKEEEIGQKTIFVQSDVKFTMSNGARIKGPCILGKNTEFQDFTIQDYAIIENSYIGAGCMIGSYVVILDSTLVKNITVHPHATIEKSIIMEKSKVYYHAEVLHSIVGKEAIVGSGVKTPCQRLKKMREEPAYVTYFTDIGIKKTEKIGAIVGDYCQIGSGTVIHPGRRIGKQSNIYANCEILRNVKPGTNIRNKDIVEGYD